MSKFKNSLYRFMQGRYGADDLNKFLLWGYFVTVVANLFLSMKILYALSLIILVMLTLRMFSKNIYQRQKENMKFIAFKTKIKRKSNLLKDRWKFRKTHIYRKCPNCKVTLRLPKVKGEHTCCCPKCRKSFKVKCR